MSSGNFTIGLELKNFSNLSITKNYKPTFFGGSISDQLTSGNL